MNVSIISYLYKVNLVPKLMWTGLEHLIWKCRLFVKENYPRCTIQQP
jgi:hypothetical protein